MSTMEAWHHTQNATGSMPKSPAIPPSDSRSTGLPQIEQVSPARVSSFFALSMPTVAPVFFCH